MAEQTDVAGEVEEEFDYVVETDTYRNFDNTTINVTVSETGGTAMMIEKMRDAGFELQNVDIVYKRFTFRKE